VDCKQAVSWIHEYLDGQLNPSDQAILDQHLRQCERCQEHFKELEMVEERVQMLRMKAAPDLSDRIMASLPAQQKSRTVLNWLKRHPALTAAAIFFIVMFSSFATMWDTNEQLVISTSEFEKIKVEGNRVIVPAGETINGDLIVENGEIIVEGQLKGNLVVIDGSYTASSANIGGRVTIINRMFDWIWYKIAGWFGTV
jgi:anti-sigma factor RsiW